MQYLYFITYLLSSSSAAGFQVDWRPYSRALPLKVLEIDLTVLWLILHIPTSDNTPWSLPALLFHLNAGHISIEDASQFVAFWQLCTGQCTQQHQLFANISEPQPPGTEPEP